MPNSSGRTTILARALFFEVATDMRRLSIAGLVAALTLGIFVVGASAQTPPPRAPCSVDKQGAPTTPCWPRTKGDPVLTEWYSDIPWHQKLGTVEGNDITEPLVLPWDALPEANRKSSFCPNSSSPSDADKARCMLETGLVSIIGIERTDTLYDPNAPIPPLDQNLKMKDAKRCPPPPPGSYNSKCDEKTDLYCNNSSLPCIEVKLALSMYYNLGNNDAVQRPIGTEPAPPCPSPPNGCLDGKNFGGFVITDGTAYAPQMPWLMSHYCNSNGPKQGINNAVCNQDYLTEYEDGFNGSPNLWPNSSKPAPNPMANAAAPWSVWPNNDSLKLGQNHCAPATTTKPPLTACTFVMAGFDLYEVSSKLGAGDATFQYDTQNKQLFDWFNKALATFPANQGTTDFQHHFPWKGAQVTWANGLYDQAKLNPFQGQYAFIEDAVPQTRPDHFLYPRKCALADLASGNAAKLRQCGLTYELHPNGWFSQWPPSYWPKLTKDMVEPNQYGRTTFLFAGVPGMQMPVPFSRNPSVQCGGTTCSVYEQVHNASLFSLYLPIANEADWSNAMTDRNYGEPSATPFYHTLLMANHMESRPENFAEGIRGKVLWHNEYRTQQMYPKAGSLSGEDNPNFPPFPFPAAFTTAKVPYHNNTCDGCHVRNGSGIPIKRGNQLDPLLTKYMNSTYSAYKWDDMHDSAKDYTFTGDIKPMKLVFFDLERVTSRIDDSVYSKPLQYSAGQIYSNPMMNFYGDSFHLNDPKYSFSYNWKYGDANLNQIVVSTARTNSELSDPPNCTLAKPPSCTTTYTYKPQQVNLSDFSTPFDPTSEGPTECGNDVLVSNIGVDKAKWPQYKKVKNKDGKEVQICTDIDGDSILAAINASAPKVGFMLLNGKRLGNLGAMEAIPSGGVAAQPPPMSIRGFRKNLVDTVYGGGAGCNENKSPSGACATAQAIAGEIVWTAGTRGGIDRDTKKACTTASLTDCYIGRFGWIGDRVSLEDQVANAAFVEMNITTSEGYDELYQGKGAPFPIRYKGPNCGPANKACNSGASNGDLAEIDVERMADYARWLGIPTRSEYMVSLPDVVAGEKIFVQTLQCNACHVISKIPITDPEDTMLSKPFRARLATHIDKTVTPNVYPFLSYLGTDLLMHDMGYLSHIAGATTNLTRDQRTGVVFDKFKNYLQKIRTPALKGLRFNRFVTESQRNTNDSCVYKVNTSCKPGCDFLLHDGRACDAIEAAFLHDGPEIKYLGTIDKLNGLKDTEIQQLRAFLYSL